MSEADLVYAMARAQHNLHDALLREVLESRISKEELALASGTPLDVVRSALADPAKLRDLNLAARLLYAASGGYLAFAVEWVKEAD